MGIAGSWHFTSKFDLFGQMCLWHQIWASPDVCGVSCSGSCTLADTIGLSNASAMCSWTRPKNEPGLGMFILSQFAFSVWFSTGPFLQKADWDQAGNTAGKSCSESPLRIGPLPIKFSIDFIPLPTVSAIFGKSRHLRTASYTHFTLGLWIFIGKVKGLGKMILRSFASKIWEFLNSWIANIRLFDSRAMGLFTCMCSPKCYLPQATEIFPRWTHRRLAKPVEFP